MGKLPFGVMVDAVVKVSRMCLAFDDVDEVLIGGFGVEDAVNELSGLIPRYSGEKKCIGLVCVVAFEGRA